MPSLDQFKELINSRYTITEWVTVNGVRGRKITGVINGNSIFLPAAGFREKTTLSRDGSWGMYWSRSLNMDYSHYGGELYFRSDIITTDATSNRCHGQSVRPVRKK